VVGELGNGAGSSVAVDLDLSHDQVTDGIGDRRSGLIGSLAMNGTTLFGEKTKDLLGELGCRGSETEERMDVGSLLQGWSRGRTQAEVERETKRAPNGGDAANDIIPIDGAAVPSVSSSVGSLDKDSVSSTVVSGNSDSFIQGTMKVLNTRRLCDGHGQQHGCLYSESNRPIGTDP
jgi:hypothetical protein